MGQADITVLYPYGNADVKAMTATGDQDFTIKSNATQIDGVTVEATGNRTINLTLDSGLRIGATLTVFSKTNGAETLTFNNNITGITITGVAGKTIVAKFEYDGTLFKQTGAEEQID